MIVIFGLPESTYTRKSMASWTGFIGDVFHGERWNLHTYPTNIPSPHPFILGGQYPPKKGYTNPHLINQVV